VPRRKKPIEPLAEMDDVRLGDRRLEERARSLMYLLEQAPGQSLPQATQTPAALEGAYRFLRNERVTLAKLLAPHMAATAARARASTSTVVVAHDTTEFRFEGDSERRGLGEVGQRGQGFFGHVALAITEERQALGVLGLSVVVRPKHRATHRERTDYHHRSAGHEGTRWRALIEEVQARAGDALPIHVMDREADEFEMLADMVEMGCRFVVRMSASRRRRITRVDGVDAGRQLVPDAANALRGVITRDVVLSGRGGKRTSGPHRPRDRRSARLQFAAGAVEVLSPRNKRGGRTTLTLSLVLVRETDPPDGEDPVEWLLYSNEPIVTPADVLAIVDAYRARWVIEEYFKALKTGCAVEKRQLESLRALVNCLGMFVPIAAKMLALRSCARLTPNAPASSVLSPVELRALRIVARTPVPAHPTAHDALYAIAALGGHLRNNGHPGWLVLARGFDTLQIAVRVLENERRM
jgi:hypothetical protein